MPLVTVSKVNVKNYQYLRKIQKILVKHKINNNIKLEYKYSFCLRAGPDL